MLNDIVTRDIASVEFWIGDDASSRVMVCVNTFALDARFEARCACGWSVAILRCIGSAWALLAPLRGHLKPFLRSLASRVRGMAVPQPTRAFPVAALTPPDPP